MKKVYTSLLTLLLLAATACTERIDLDLESADPVIVIYGTVTDTLGYQSISISSSVPYFDKADNPAVSGALVSITAPDNETWQLYESETEKGLYRTDEPKAGKAGSSYHLRVECDFDGDGARELYEATSSMLPTFNMDSVEVIQIHHMGRSRFTACLYAQEPAGEDFYVSKYFVNDSLVTKLSEYGLMDDALTDGQYLNGIMVYNFSDRRQIDDYDEEEQNRRKFVSPGDTVTVEFARVEEGYFNFITQAQRMKNGENPMFGGPPSNIQGNISNGGAGYFAAFSRTSMKTVVPQGEETN